MDKKQRNNSGGNGSGKSEYWLTDDGLTLIHGWARDGLTDEQIAANIGVARSTLAVWKGKYKRLSDALKKGKDIADRRVENALYKRAVGYRYTEITTGIDKETGQTVVIKTVEKEALPDVTACIYWLKNRKPDKWRDKRETEITGCEVSHEPDSNIMYWDFSQLTEEQLKALTQLCTNNGCTLKDEKGAK